MAKYNNIAGNIGTFRKPTAELQIVTGAQLSNSSKQTTSIAVGEGIEFYSGQPIWVTSGVYPTASTNADGSITYSPEDTVTQSINGNIYVDSEWYWTTDPDAGEGACHFAWTDSTEFIAAGKIMGVSSNDNYELQSVFFDTSRIYKPGDVLTAKEVEDLANDEGNTPCTGTVVITNDVDEGDQIIGVVTKGVININGYTGHLSVNETESGRATITGGPKVFTEPTKSKVTLQFATRTGTVA